MELGALALVGGFYVRLKSEVTGESSKTPIFGEWMLFWKDLFKMVTLLLPLKERVACWFGELGHY